ncbi:CDP-glucose 4,6-dehydratase [Syntrophus gentianae]|uniref:CDP-glucose 4,6-dehydratase n=1 Tax=Syntrophus gentianae TaxID=43775 RepID=A0A1H7ZB14_9BACT|nr:CDP-glucose 4,6-dehydratase [Syntrophus gentianae]SEM54679.1 CDP-glucose 4,6-dehydratase [Syntrophus gentianae]
MFDNIYQNKTVLITGHTGFKGSWLALWLKELGANVIGYSLAPPSQPNNFEVTNLREKMTDVRGDIRDLDCLLETFTRYQPELVFHLAAQPIVRCSYNEPKMTFDTNVGGTVNIFEAVRRTSSVKVLVNVTSDKCYENRERVWGYRENDPLGGHDPYSASKACAELVFNAYLKSYFSQSVVHGRTIGAASVRAGNVIGGGDWGVDRLVPDCIRSLSRNRPVFLRNPRSVRPWQHVLEALGGYLLLGACLSQNPEKYSGAWNFGPDDGSHLTVLALTDLLIKFWGEGVWVDISDSTSPHEAKLLKLNCDKAHAGLNWHNVLTIDECLQMTAQWYQKYYRESQSRDLSALCIEQIRDYMDLAEGRLLDLGVKIATSKAVLCS